MDYELHNYSSMVSPILIAGMMMAAPSMGYGIEFNLRREESSALDSANRKIEEARQKRLKEKEMRRMKREND